MGFQEQAELSENREFRIKVRQAVIAEARNQAKPTVAGRRRKREKRQNAAFMIIRGGNYIQQFWPIVAAAVDGNAEATDTQIAEAVADAFDEIAMVTAEDDVDDAETTPEPTEEDPVVRTPLLPSP